MHRQSNRRAQGPSGAPRRLPVVLGAVALLVVPTACRSMPEQRIDPQSVLAAVRTTRSERPADTGLTLSEATRLMRRGNPEIRAARAAYATAQAQANVRTPPANPTLGIGPLLFGGADILTSGTWGIATSLGWTVALSGKRALADAVSNLQARQAFAELVAVERTEYLGLRSDLVQAGMAHDRLEAERNLAAQAKAAADVGRGLVEAGQASSVDHRLLRLDAARAEADVSASAESAEERRQALAGRMGIAPGGVTPPTRSTLPPLPPAAPEVRTLVEGTIKGHPRLCVLRAAFLVAEKELRLEVARARPDLSMGLGFEVESENYLSLPLGIELPIFDRNQVGLARAKAVRDEARMKFRAEMERILTSIAAAHARVATRAEHLRRLEQHVAPEAEGALAATRSALAAGGADALRYLEVLRTARAVSLEVRDARAALYEAWSDLEQACGLPLLRFPHEPGGGMPTAVLLPPPPPLPAPAPMPAPMPEDEETES